MKKKCVIVGGGLAGLASAVYLTKAGFQITLLESSPKLGGRAYSFRDNKTGSEIDNGQHILMGCYDYTLDFFKEIGASRNLIKQENLKVNFLKEDYNLLPLSAPKLFYPLNLFCALIGYKAFDIEDKLRLASFFSKLPLYSSKDLERMTVSEWLLKENQSENSIKSFWDILIVGALNTSKEKASALIFAGILKKIFLGGNKAATIIIPKLGLTPTYCNNSENYIKASEGEVCLGESVIEFKNTASAVTEIVTSKRIIKDYDYVISTVPLFAYTKINKDKKLRVNINLEYSTILSIHIWLSRNTLKELFYGLIDSPVHWIFNHGKYITLVISDADDMDKKDSEEIFNLAAGEIEKYIKIRKEDIISYKIIKEKRATFIPTRETLKKRPSPETPLNNFFLAGDWINTGLPSTIEGAVKSGKSAADIVAEKSRAVS